MAGGKRRYTADEVVAALKETQGLAALAADRLGCTAMTIYNYRDRYASVRAALAHNKERRVDIAEGQLWKLIQEKNVAAVIFYLKTQGRRRGYADNTQGSIDDPLHHIDWTPEEWKLRQAEKLRQAQDTFAVFEQDADSDAGNEDA